MSTEMTDEKYMALALAQARRSPPKPTNFCVGAVLVSPSSQPAILATGYTLEMPGNTHAEQSCLMKFAQEKGCDAASIGRYLPEDAVLYTTMEPCNERLSGNLPCVDRILQTHWDGEGIRKVCVGVLEPEKFVGENHGRQKLEHAGVKVVQIHGLEDEILRVATAGHDR